MLSGFLGTGKTTLLKHWLENAEGRIGVIVNDVASVNIDAKLVRAQGGEVQNGFNAIQLENGCACCSLGDELISTIYDLLELAEGGEPFSHIVVELSGVAEPGRVRENFALSGAGAALELNKVVTLVDASTFCQDYMEFRQMYERPDLMEDNSGEMADLKVVELLVEQIEEADAVVLNKTDLAGDELLPATRSVVRALNTKAALHETSFGKVALASVLKDPAEQGHAHENHSDSAHQDKCCGHGHGHEEHGHEEHGHEEHAHAEHGHECKSHEGHSHECSDPTCTDPSHEHGHDHSHAHAATTAEERFGITSFIYTARRPFQYERLSDVLREWPVPRKDCLGEALRAKEADSDSPFACVIRSKGFCWLNSYPSTRMYWSHAGKSLRFDFDGPWWASLPPEQLRYMEGVNHEEYERVMREDWADDVGDKRQELVLIGQRMDEAAIRSRLDACLLRDGEEMEAYLQEEKMEMSKKSLWAAAQA